MKYLELLRKRTAVIEEARKLVDKTDDENRDFTPAEHRQFYALLGEADYLAKVVGLGPIGEPSMNDRAYLKALEEDLEKPLNDPIRPTPGGYRSVTGDEIRIFDPRESVRSGFSYDLPDGIDPEELSIGRWVRGIVTGNWSGAEAERRAMSTLDDTLGGYMLPDPLALEVIDLARAKSVLVGAGARTVPMETKTLTMARVTGDPAGYWKGENQEGTESEMSLGALKLVSKTLMAIVRLSIEVFEDSPNVSQVVQNALALALALELDRAGLFGEGSEEEPRGIYSDPDLSELSMGDNGAALSDYSPFVQAIQKVEDANGAAKVAIYAPRTKAEIALLADTTGQPLQAPRSVADLKHMTSTQIPVDLEQGTAEDASVAFVGDFNQVMIGVRKNVTLDIAKEESDAFKKLQVLVRAYLRADVVTAHPDQICRVVGIIPGS